MSELIHIRPAIEADLPTINTILRAVIQNPYGSGNIDEEEVAEELERISSALKQPESGTTLIAENSYDKKNVGFAFFGDPNPKLLEFTNSDPATTLELRLLYPDPTERSRGVGSTLLKAVENSALSMGLQRIELTSGPRYFLIGSGIFYRKMGYQQLGIIPRYFNELYPAKVFQKVLKRED